MLYSVCNLKTKQRRFNENEMWKWESIQTVKYDFKFLISATRNDRFSIFCEENCRSRFQKGRFSNKFYIQP